MSLFDQLKQHLADNQLCALATVIQAPNGMGAKLLVLPDGSGQGDMRESLRSEVIARAQALMRTESSQMVDIGDAKVFIEVYAPPPTLIIFGAVHTAIPLSPTAPAHLSEAFSADHTRNNSKKKEILNP